MSTTPQSALDVIVVGGGIGGSAATLRAVQYNLRTAWILGDSVTDKQSRAKWVVNVDNMIGIHPGIMVDKILGLLSGPEMQAAREKIERAHFHIGTRDIVENVRSRIHDEFASLTDVIEARATAARRREDGTFEVDAGGKTYAAPYAVLATGVMDRQPLIQKESKGTTVDAPDWIYPFSNRESVLYCIRCEGHLTAESCVAIIGSSESAAYVAMMLLERYGSTCAILTNGETPTWPEDLDQYLRSRGVRISTERITDLSGKKGALHAITLANGDRIEVAFALVALGLFRVYNDLARDLGATLTNPEAPIDVRHVLVDEKSETSIDGLFAVGDMTRLAERAVMKQIYTAQEYAVRAVDQIDARVRRRRRELRPVVA